MREEEELGDGDASGSGFEGSGYFRKDGVP